MPESKPFKRRDVKPCCVCGKGVAQGGIDFYRLHGLDHMVLDPGAIRRTDGLEKFFGGGGAGAMLANAMGDDPDLAHTLDSTDEVLVCSKCALEAPLAQILEVAADRDSCSEEDDGA